MNTSKPKIIIENSFSHIIQVVLNNLKMKQKIVFSFVRRLKAKNIRNDFFFFTAEDDLDYLLGIKPKPSATDRLGDNEITNKSAFAVKNSSSTLTDGWGDSSITSGWDDFDISSGSLLIP